MSVLDVAIVGGGVAGLLCALELVSRGHRCTLFDAPGRAEPCSPKGGGMLAPISELDQAEPEIAFLGLDAPARWEAILGPDERSATLTRTGSLLLAHRPEWPLLTQLQQRARAAGLGDRLEDVDAARIAALEPWTAGRFRRGLFLSSEGVVHPAALLPTLRARVAARGVSVHPVRVEAFGPGGVRAEGTEHRADMVVDCRGLEARAQHDLRGVRGEFLVLRSATPSLGRPVRLMHPRYPLYVIPRPDGRYYVGATQLESEDEGPTHVRSALELLSALYSLDPAFADAEIEAFGVGLRPAYPDNRPHVHVAPGVVACNGLFRHGYLLSPLLSTWVADAVEGRPPSPEARPFHTAEG